MNKPIGGEQDTPRLARMHSAETPLRANLRAALMALALWVLLSAVYAWTIPLTDLSLQVGEPSPRDIKAPRSISYTSDAETQAARLQAVAQVEDVYAGPNSDILQERVRLLDALGSMIVEIRGDETLQPTDQVDALMDLPQLVLSASHAEALRDLSEQDLEAVLSESQRLLQAAMWQEIRPHEIGQARRSAAAQVSLELEDLPRELAVALAQPMIVPNSRLDQAASDQAREQALQDVEPIYRNIQEGESLLREGEIVSLEALEAMQVLGLLDAQTDWQRIVSQSLIFLLLIVTLSVYVLRTHPLLIYRPRRLALFLATLLLVGASARLAIPGHTLTPYLFPAAAAAMLIAVLLDVQLGIVTAMVTAVLVGLNAPSSVEAVVYVLLGGLLGALVLSHLDQLGAFVRAAVYVALANVVVIVGFRLATHVYDPVGLLQLGLSALASAFISTSLTFIAYAFSGRVFGITTSLQLLELARPTHPLFRQVLLNAPGTYHHSIVISNMAERAAEEIGADGLLARVGSYYHDIGKTLRPYFFAENQAEGENPHDKLDPRTSADIVIAHTTDGLRLAKKHKLPKGVAAFIPEHHGTTRVTYFYRRALAESDGEPVVESDFCYPGPKPQTRETAIVMLADSIEATVRATGPGTQDEIERTIRQIINDRLISGQLDECDLTLRDLDVIREAFGGVLKGIFHPRIKYPEKQRRRATNGSAGGN